MNDMKLWYINPASKWEETLPIGNGSLGAMIWGNINEELLGLNEESLWSGYPYDKNNSEVYSYLQKVRDLVKKKEYAKAEQMVQDHMLGEYGESYVPLGSLRLHFNHAKEVTKYQRQLDIEQSIATVEYQSDGVDYKREYFASYVHKAILIRLTASKKVMNVEVAFESELPFQCVVGKDIVLDRREEKQEDVSHQQYRIQFHGQCPEHVDPSYLINKSQPIIQGTKGMEFDGEVLVLSSDGKQEAKDDKLSIIDASEIVLAISAVQPIRNITYNYNEMKSDNIEEKKQIYSKNYEDIKQEHMMNYKELYDRVEIYLGEQLNLPTNERLKNLKNGEDDNGLYALYFQYARYLLISSSREGGLPANLQGIWSWEVRAPWSSNWTTNINVQMNYWLAQSCNLKECLEPYFEFVKRICDKGKETAIVNYHCRGTVHHHNADYWLCTNPMGVEYSGDICQGAAGCCMWPMGGVWLASSELLKHYEYNQDMNFLQDTVYPVLRENVLFLLDWLYFEDGVYNTCPSTSPENHFLDEEKNSCSVSKNSTMDLELIRDLFGQFQRTCSILQIEDELLEQVKEHLEQLPEFKTGSEGQLLEWEEELEEAELGHRHISHLYGMFPSELFEGNEAMKEAVRKSLERRLAYGGGHTGWSCAWIMNMYAILGDSEKAYEFLHTLLTRSTYPNLWDAHPPFQIDGNFGGAAGIANMFVQDRGGEVKLLPALPKKFANGYVKGLRIKGGKTVDIEWKDGALERACYR